MFVLLYILIKMTFSYEVKKELAGLAAGEPECALAELSAIIHTGGELGIASIGYYIEIVSDNELLKIRADTLLKKLYGVTGELTAWEGGLKNQRCVLRVAGGVAERILFDCSLLRFNKDNLTEIVAGIDPYLVNEIPAAQSYIRGAFLASGSAGMPAADGKGGGYQLAFNLSNGELASGLQRLLAENEIISGKFAGKGGFVVYLKEHSMISDALALMGAPRAVLRLNSAVVERQLRNQINRQNNFMGANIGRSSSAAADQIRAIRAIEKGPGLNSLPQQLKELAGLRLKYPGYSMSEILPLVSGEITKGGLNHRFEKLIKTANELKSDGV